MKCLYVIKFRELQLLGLVEKKIIEWVETIEHVVPLPPIVQKRGQNISLKDAAMCEKVTIMEPESVQ